MLRKFPIRSLVLYCSHCDTLQTRSHRCRFTRSRSVSLIRQKTRSAAAVSLFQHIQGNRLLRTSRHNGLRSTSFAPTSGQFIDRLGIKRQLEPPCDNSTSAIDPPTAYPYSAQTSVHLDRRWPFFHCFRIRIRLEGVEDWSRGHYRRPRRRCESRSRTFRGVTSETDPVRRPPR